MIVEERLYTLKPECPVGALLEVYESTGALELQKRVLGRLIGYFTTEVGMLNCVVHLWGYESFEDRARRRAALNVESVWKDYLEKVRPMLASMENRLLLPTAFSPIR